MDQSPFSEAKRHSTTQEIFRLLGTQIFITVLIRARHLSLSWARCIQSTPSHPVSLRPILIFYFHLRLRLRVFSFRQFFRRKCLCLSHFSHVCCMPRAANPPWLDHPNYIRWRANIPRNWFAVNFFVNAWKGTASHSWHSVTCRRVDEIWDDQNHDGETNTILGTTGTDLNDLTLKYSWWWWCIQCER